MGVSAFIQISAAFSAKSIPPASNQYVWCWRLGHDLHGQSLWQLQWHGCRAERAVSYGPGDRMIWAACVCVCRTDLIYSMDWARHKFPFSKLWTCRMSININSMWDQLKLGLAMSGNQASCSMKRHCPFPSLFLLHSSTLHLACFLFYLLLLFLVDDPLSVSVFLFLVALPYVQLLLKPEKQFFHLRCLPLYRAFMIANRNIHSLKWPIIGW